MATISSSSFSTSLWASAMSKSLFNGVTNLYQIGPLLNNLTTSSFEVNGNTISGYTSDGGSFILLGSNFSSSKPVISSITIEHRPLYYLDVRGSISASTLTGSINYFDLIVGAEEVKVYGSVSMSGYGSLTKIIYSNGLISFELVGLISSSAYGMSGNISQINFLSGNETFSVSGGNWNYSALNNINSYDDFYGFVTQGSDVINGGTKNDLIKGGLGNDTINGQGGLDAVIYSGASTSYNVKAGVQTTVTDKVSNRDGTDTLTNVERLKFSDANVALDVGPAQNAGSVYMIYKAAFNRAPDASGMGYWLAQKDNGSDIVTNIAQGFVNSAEFIAKYGANPTTASFVDKLYQNVLGRSGDAGGIAYWNQQLDSGNVSKAAALVAFATLPEGASNVASLIANGIAYTEWVG